jgi:hypothetical protein
MHARIALVLLTLVAWPTRGTADEFRRGWCAGYTAAIQATHYNRDQWRRLTGAPTPSYEEVRSALAHRPTRRLSVADSVDRFVVLPLPEEQSVWYFGAPTTPHFRCPSGEVLDPPSAGKE